MSAGVNFRSSCIFFGSLEDAGFDKVLKENYPQSRFVILTDENVSQHWSEFLVTSFDSLSRAEIIEIPAGEENKNISICQSVWEALTDYEINRNDVIINLGGGMITDVGGFVASTFKRGLRFINIPTSLLAQVDASVGGKTGIDLGPYKNQVGVFAEPEFVFCDNRFLSTLPQEQIISGYAEMLKHALIADSDYWHKLVAINPSSEFDFSELVKKSVEIKKSIVEQDFNEAGIRKTLNFGHTIGHALEGFFLEQEKLLLHGHVVGLGMISEAWISKEMKLISDVEFNQVESVCKNYFGKYLPEKFNSDRLLELMQNDKKNANGKINFSLLDGIGKCKFDVEVSTDLILRSLEYFKK